MGWTILFCCCVGFLSFNVIKYVSGFSERLNFAVSYGYHGDFELFHEGVVGYDNDCCAVGAIVAEEEVEDFAAGFGVEAAGGFVGENEIGVVCYGAGDGDALFLSAGQLAGAGGQVIVEADFCEGLAGAFATVGYAAVAEEEGSHYVVDGGAFFSEEEVLEYEADAFVSEGGELGVGHAADVDAVEFDVAGIGSVEAAAEFEEGGFSGAAAADDGREGSAGELEVGVFKDFDGAISTAVCFGYVFAR